MFGFGHVDNAQVGAIVATFAAGTVLGGIASGFINNAWGRRFALSTSLVLSIIGATIQTAANGVPMMIAGRIIAGLAIGILLSTMPIYISEIAPPETRGRLVGIQGLFDATGFFLANWVGFAGSYADGNAQWRIPLGMQIPAALVLLVLVQFLPQSPRWRKYFFLSPSLFLSPLSFSLSLLFFPFSWNIGPQRSAVYLTLERI